MPTPKEIYQIKAECLNDLVGIFRQAGPPNPLDAAIKTHTAMCNATQTIANVYQDKADGEK